jgi:hypothetical protein
MISVQIQAQTEEMWGVTRTGGLNDAGVIYKLDSNGSNYKVVKEFAKTEGSTPQGLTEGANGMLYGFSDYAGLYSGGVFFEYDPILDKQRTLFHFYNPVTGTYPNNKPIEISNGVFIGSSTIGIFEFNVNTMQFTVKQTAASLYGGRLRKMMKANNGKIYGIISRPSYAGDRIFEYNPTTNSLITKYSFPTNRSNGFDAVYEMVEATNGDLYGTTRVSTGAGGVLFTYNYLTNTFTKRKHLSVSIASEPILHSNGKVYFHTYDDGQYNNGRLYEYQPSNNALVIKHDKDSIGNTIPFELNPSEFLFARYPDQGIAPGYLYKYSINNNITTTLDSIGAEQNWVVYSFFRHSSGRIFGISNYQIFELDTITFKMNVRTRFNYFFDGNRPSGELLHASDGYIYGTTESGFTKLYKINPNTLEYEVIHTFNTYRKHYTNQGSGAIPKPYGHLVEVNNRYLYGTASVYRNTEEDIFYKYDLVNDTMYYLAKFYNTTTGSKPDGNLILTANNTILGTCRDGGANNSGTIYEYDLINDTIINKLDFPTSIKTPSSGFIPYGTNKYWGISEEGGGYSAGTLYEYDYSANTVQVISKVKTNNNSSNYGQGARGNICITPNHKYYGVTEDGGNNNAGMIFEVDTNAIGVVGKLHIDNFLSVGSNLKTGLFLSPRGKIMGLGYYGGINQEGSLFEYDTLNNVLSTVFSFDDSLGTNPQDAVSIISFCRTPGIPQLSSSLDTVCSPTFVTIKTDSNSILNNGAYWGLYIDSSLTTPIDTSSKGEFNYSVSRNTKFYVRGEGGCATNGKFNEIEVVYDSTYVKVFSRTINRCKGGSFIRPLGDTIKNILNSFIDTSIVSSSLTGCDSLIKTVVMINPLDTSWVTETICYGDNYLLPDSTFTASLFSDTIYKTVLNKRTTGCDSTIFTTLKIDLRDTTVVLDTVCYGDIYLLPNSNQTAPLFRDTTIYTIIGALNLSCDSTIESRIVIEQIDTTLQVNGLTLTSNASRVNYQWINCMTNSSIIGETNKSFTATQNGIYSVELSGINNCIDTSYCYTILGVGLNELNKSENLVSISPNPTKGEFEIIAEDSFSIQNIEIYSIRGQKINNFDFNLSTQKVRLNSSAGVYFLRVILDKGQTELIKVIKQ